MTDSDDAALDEVVYSFEVQEDPTVWKVVRVHFVEALSELYECTLEVCTEATDAVPEDLVEQRAVFTARRGGTERRVCGVLAGAEDVGIRGDQRVARVQLVPALYWLGQRTNWRIFQDQTALEVVVAVLTDAGLYAGDLLDRSGLGALKLLRRPYCVQFGESDLDFVRRLLEDEGLGFRFAHEGFDETLALFDGGLTTGYPAAPTADGLPVQLLEAFDATTTVETVQRFDWIRAARPTGVVLRDFDMVAPDAVSTLTSAAPAAPGARSLYEYPGGYGLGGTSTGSQAQRHDGGRRATGRAQAEALGSRRARGRGHVLGFAPGRTFELEASEHDGRYLVLRVSHRGHAPEALHAVGGAGAAGAVATDDRYVNHFECVSADVVYRPARAAPRPRAHFPQTALVCAEPGTTDPIVTDALGRVLVRFHWDRQLVAAGQPAGARSSCWLRVAQPWAGAGFGALFIPRVGTEVIVQFLDGDPDRPVVTGSLYNGASPTPLGLPGARTQSAIRTASVGGEPGYNELRFEDAAGSEEVYVRAQRDFNALVLNNQSTDVVAAHSLTVGADSAVTIGANRVETVRGERVATVMGGDTLTVLGDRTVSVDGAADRVVRGEGTERFEQDFTVRVGGAYALAVGRDEGEDGEATDATLTVRGSYYTSVDDDVVLQARKSISIQCGPNRIELTQEGVTIRAKALSVEVEKEAGIHADDLFLTAKDDLEINAEEIRAYGFSSRMVLGKGAELRGQGVKVGRGGGKPFSMESGDPHEALFKFEYAGSRDPIEGLKVLIRHPDGSEQEYATDAKGEIKLTGGPKELFTIVNVVGGGAMSFHRHKLRRRPA